jgi:hypothetical protein
MIAGHVMSKRRERKQITRKKVGQINSIIRRQREVTTNGRQRARRE